MSVSPPPGRADARGDGVKVAPLPAPVLPPGRPKLIVTGFAGAGKTEAGRLAAERLGLPFVDLDRAIERRAGASITAIFEREGEAGFRAREREVVTEATRLSACVVATGGGSVLDAESFAGLAEGSVVVVLRADPAEIARRLGNDGGRPLLEGDVERRARTLLAERAHAYGAAGEPLDTTGRLPPAVAEEVASRYPRLDDLRLRAGPTLVLVGRGTLASIGEEIRRAVPSARGAAVAADAAVAHTIGARTVASIDAAGLRSAVLALPEGEAAKDMHTASSLWRDFLDLGLGRDDVVVAVGGGAALDAAGFAAATYMRGVAHVCVPTTLLASVDAAIGGKVAVDVAGAKNLAGAFHHPRLVVCDPNSLADLPPEGLRHGLAEAVKMLALASPLALEALEDDPPIWWVIEQAIRVKAAYVSADPQDRGLRASLNLGHTFAHAIESASGYTVPHGEAVSIGLVAATRLGEALGVTTSGEAERLGALLVRLGLPTAPPRFLPSDAMTKAMLADKKRRGDRAVFVVPGAGGAALAEGVTLRTALEAMRT